MKKGGLFGIDINDGSHSIYQAVLVLEYGKDVISWMPRAMAAANKVVEKFKEEPDFPAFLANAPPDVIKLVLLAKYCAEALLAGDENTAAGYAHAIMTYNRAHYGVLSFTIGGDVSFVEINAESVVEASAKIELRLQNMQRGLSGTHGPPV